MKTIRPILALAILAAAGALLVSGHAPLAIAFLFLAGTAYATPRAEGWCQTPTLTATEMLIDVIKAFAVRIPAARRLGNQFSTTGLKLNKAYMAHIAALPTAEAVTTTYAVTGNDAKEKLSDVDITVSSRYGTRLYWKNLDLIKDDKVQYDRVISGAGYSLAKVFIDDLLTQAKGSRFSQSSIFTEANSDADMLDDICSDMNGVGAGENRVMIVNSGVATSLNADARVASGDYNGRLQGGNPYRMWENLNGFSMIQEYPSLSLNNGTAITGGAIEADDDVYTKTAHGLETGDRVVLTSFSGGTGLTAATVWYFSKLTANTGYLCATPADAIAGTLGTACTVDATSVVLTPTENVTGFATDLTGINFLAGPEDHAAQDRLIGTLNIQRVLNVETVTEPESGITMSAVSYQEATTGDLTWMPVMLWGKVAGRKAGANAVGSYCDYGGHILRKA